MSEMSEQRRWSVEIFHVSGHDRQQRILEAFRDIGRTEVTALGTQSGRDWFVIVETCTWDDIFFVRNTVSTIDVHATRAYSYKSPSVLGPMPAL
jgi:hypothetical protein